jgi:MoxR-like ATPase
MLDKLQALRQELNQNILEREQIIDGLLSCLLSRQHILLLGSPGTAKSLLSQQLCSAISGANYFQWLLTKFSTPEEIFGPISVQALQQDSFRRKVDGKLPTAHLSFIDEIYKANSSILNSLLSLLNERTFYNDGVPVRCPLITVVGASNELPEKDELDALHDRFILRYWVNYLDDPVNLKTVLLSDDKSNVQTQITLGELELMQVEASRVRVDDALIDNLLNLKLDLAKAGFVASDRRWKQILKLLKAYAYLQGSDQVSVDHFPLLIDAMWAKPSDIPEITAVMYKAFKPVSMQLDEIQVAANEAVKQLGRMPEANGDRPAWLNQAVSSNQALQQMLEQLDKLSIDSNLQLKYSKVKKKVIEQRNRVLSKISTIVGV